VQTSEYDPLSLPDYEVDLYVGSIVSGPSGGPAALHGTAFFIKGEGNFLTAAHVLQAAIKKVEGTGERICLTVRVPGTRQINGLYLVSFDFAPAPFDIAVGRVAGRSQSFVKLANATAGAPLRDVMTFGYPESAQQRLGSGDLLLSHRAHKGHILRNLAAGQLSNFPHPPMFELNFAIPSALSGAPLVLERPATPLEHALMAAPGQIPMIGMGLVDVRFMPKHALHLLGVCVGTTQAETVAFSHTEVVDGETKFHEKTCKIELYGLAHDLRPLSEWKPECLGGQTLAAAISPT
jgi:hypothetical protein